MIDCNVWMMEYPFSYEIRKDGQEKGKPSIMSTTNHKTPHCCRA